MWAAATVTKERNPDIASTVVSTMHKLGVAGIPRNYEIFYEALIGSNPELSLAVVALASHPSQEELDEIGRQFFTQNHGQGIVEQARDVLAKELEDIASLLRSERSQVEKYGKILDETSGGLANRATISRELLDKIVTAVQTATNSTIARGRQVAETLTDKSAELESVKSKLEEYKRLADTDPLTQIWNRRAFDKEIARIYDGGNGVRSGSLILVDIDRFKDINDKFGHPVGDKIIRNVADILQSGVRRGVFVARTGGEEFALIIEGTGETVTAEIAERLRKLVEQTRFSGSQSGADFGAVTISVGICMAAEAASPEDLYSKADQALYRSKVAGRNRVTRYAPLADQSTKKWMMYRKD